MSTLVLDTQAYQLSLQQGLLRCHHPEKGTRLLPWHGLSQIMIAKGVTIESEVLLKAAEYGVGVVLIGSRIKQLACVYPLKAPADDFRLHQYAMFSDKSMTKKLATLLMLGRMQGQKKTLCKLGIEPSAEWRYQATQLPLTDNLMLTEARMTAQYWQLLATRLTVFGFSHRERQPPCDPVNALVSLTSTLEDPLYAKALLGQGFDIGLGIHHSTGYYRHSLLLDIKELTRSELEYWVAGLFLSGQITASHFHHTDQGCRLTTQGQQVFYPLWFGFCRQHKKRVHKWAIKAKRLLLQQGIKDAA
ncbi:CRISPR-associated endonuclease Cas1 [Photobacterium damselae]|uniref:CRISPR-associated endonuclease Cas1 n=1 Tax=Photobacterium damselae TaxID=38293 RepID=UPI00165D9C6B|nr:CRISPR-associated endonuclease Cas1 [Photobacterium damselae]EHA1079991.1 CRISPR-associated endonuclease Cas1 [Photobacterium damselae]EHA1083017.1 CRISPR-associated endonuclease Cas1 [Photobacterium damselae]